MPSLPSSDTAVVGELVRAMPTRDVLRTYASLLDELIARGIVRSRNAPAGDVAELLVARAYEGELAPPSEKSWDVLAAGRRIQVKSRVIVSGVRSTQQYSPFRSWDFDACVFVTFDASTYDVSRALDLAASDVQAIAKAVDWVAGSRVSVSQVRASAAIDVTDRVREALLRIDDPA